MAVITEYDGVVRGSSVAQSLACAVQVLHLGRLPSRKGQDHQRVLQQQSLGRIRAVKLRLC